MMSIPAKSEKSWDIHTFSSKSDSFMYIPNSLGLIIYVQFPPASKNWFLYHLHLKRKETDGLFGKKKKKSSDTWWFLIEATITGFILSYQSYLLCSLWLHGCLVTKPINIQEKFLMIASVMDLGVKIGPLDNCSTSKRASIIHATHATHATSHCRSFFIILGYFSHNSFSGRHQRWYTIQKANNMINTW